MNPLLARLTGTEIPPQNPPLNGVENGDENPLHVPDEWLDLTPDPPPAAHAASTSLLGTPATGRVTPALRNKIAAEIEMYADFMALPLVMRDPVCGQALADQAKPIAKAIAKILSRYPDLAHKFVASGAIGDWLALGMAVMPVGKAIYAHHIAPQPQEEHRHDDGTQLPPGFDPFRPGS